MRKIGYLNFFGTSRATISKRFACNTSLVAIVVYTTETSSKQRLNKYLQNLGVHKYRLSFFAVKFHLYERSTHHVYGNFKP